MRRKGGSGKGLMIALLIVLILAGIGAGAWLVRRIRQEQAKGGTPLQQLVNTGNPGGTPGGTTGGTGTGTVPTTPVNPAVPVKTPPTASEEDALYYYYNQLSAEDQALYKDILAGLQQVEPTITVATGDEERMNHIRDMILFDHPELFWLGDTYHYTTYSDYIDLQPAYAYTGAEKDAMQAEVDAQTAAALAEIGNPESDYEKVKAAFRYVVLTVDYISEAPDNQTLYSSLVNHQSVCAGYSREMQYLCQKMGIQCLYVPGDIKDEDTHSWNIVRLNDQYYQVDVTFGDSESRPDQNRGSAPEELKLAWQYLCCTDEELYRDHVVRTEETWVTLPVCTATDLEYYRMEDAYVEQYDDTVWDKVKASLEAKEPFYSFQFGTQEAFDSFVQALDEGKYGDIVREVDNPGTFRTWSRSDDDMWVVSGWYE